MKAKTKKTKLFSLEYILREYKFLIFFIGLFGSIILFSYVSNKSHCKNLRIKNPIIRVEDIKIEASCLSAKSGIFENDIHLDIKLTRELTDYELASGSRSSGFAYALFNPSLYIINGMVDDKKINDLIGNYNNLHFVTQDSIIIRNVEPYQALWLFELKENICGPFTTITLKPIGNYLIEKHL
ncbi:MAG: hypothetical protein NTX91_03195 [candidate division SR1 bacterium]|nr:hypothetical protein [candidate division SR1 bacterium]